MPDKNQLRQTLLEQRQALLSEQIHIASQRIQHRLVSQDFWGRAENVGLYFPMKNEVDTSFLLQQGLESGKSIYYPRVEQGLVFSEINSLTDLVRGAFGLMEPQHTCPILKANENLDLILVPGIGFDTQGFRIGYGKGFYDRYLSHKKNFAVGLAYEFQIISEIIPDPWDQKVQFLITEKQTYAFPS